MIVSGIVVCSEPENFVCNVNTVFCPTVSTSTISFSAATDKSQTTDFPQGDIVVEEDEISDAAFFLGLSLPNTMGILAAVIAVMVCIVVFVLRRRRQGTTVGKKISKVTNGEFYIVSPEPIGESEIDATGRSGLVFDESWLNLEGNSGEAVWQSGRKSAQSGFDQEGQPLYDDARAVHMALGVASPEKGNPRKKKKAGKTKKHLLLTDLGELQADSGRKVVQPQWLGMAEEARIGNVSTAKRGGSRGIDGMLSPDFANEQYELSRMVTPDLCFDDSDIYATVTPRFGLETMMAERRYNPNVNFQTQGSDKVMPSGASGMLSPEGFEESDGSFDVDNEEYSTVRGVYGSGPAYVEIPAYLTTESSEPAYLQAGDDIDYSQYSRPLTEDEENNYIDSELTSEYSSIKSYAPSNENGFAASLMMNHPLSKGRPADGRMPLPEMSALMLPRSSTESSDSAGSGRESIFASPRTSDLCGKGSKLVAPRTSNLGKHVTTASDFDEYSWDAAAMEELDHAMGYIGAKPMARPISGTDFLADAKIGSHRRSAKRQNPLFVDEDVEITTVKKTRNGSVKRINPLFKGNEESDGSDYE